MIEVVPPLLLWLIELSNGRNDSLRNIAYSEPFRCLAYGQRHAQMGTNSRCANEGRAIVVVAMDENREIYR